jgi:hypothetical protein
MMRIERDGSWMVRKAIFLLWVLIDGNAQNLMVGEIEPGGMNAEVRALLSWWKILFGVESIGVLNWMYVGWVDSEDTVDWKECWRARLWADVSVVVGSSVVMRRKFDVWGAMLSSMLLS